MQNIRVSDENQQWTGGKTNGLVDLTLKAYVYSIGKWPRILIMAVICKWSYPISEKERVLFTHQ